MNGNIIMSETMRTAGCIYAIVGMSRTDYFT